MKNIRAENGCHAYELMTNLSDVRVFPPIHGKVSVLADIGSEDFDML